MRMLIWTWNKGHMSVVVGSYNHVEFFYINTTQNNFHVWIFSSGRTCMVEIFLGPQETFMVDQNICATKKSLNT